MIQFMAQCCQKYALHQKSLQFYQDSIQSYLNFPDSFLSTYIILMKMVYYTKCK